MNNDKDEHDIIETRYTVGPGIRQAILWGTFIITFLLGMATGWYLCNEHYKNEASTKQVEVLQDDTKAVFDIQEEAQNAEVIIRNIREDRGYESNCADMLVRDVVK